MLLSDLNPGQKARILGVSEGSSAALRLLDIGFTPGTLVQVKACASGGNPMLIEIRKNAVILRKQEAACILISRVSNQ